MNLQRCPSLSLPRRTIAALLLALLPAGHLGAVTLSISRSEVYSNNPSRDGTNFCAGSGIPVQFKCNSDNNAVNVGIGPAVTCHTSAGGFSNNPHCGNISNEPHIEFESLTQSAVTNCAPASDTEGGIGNSMLVGTVGRNYCNDSVFLCTAIGWGSELTTAVPLDEIMFELFQFSDGANPFDPGSTPALRTFFIDNPGVIPNAGSGTIPGSGTDAADTVCVLWDGSQNIQGENGKKNGQFGFRITARTQVQNGQAGNITITAVRAYPAGATRDSSIVNFVSQKPIVVDVTDVHLVRTSATVVGSINPVVTEPYNFSYRLSKDATMYITIQNSANQQVVQTVVPGLPRIGEGVPNGTLLNGDLWNGRYANGDFAPPGVYLATLQAFSSDQYGTDLSLATTRQIEVDPLLLTDIRVAPLTLQATSLAVLNYILTEPATVFIDIYPPATQFCSGGPVLAGLPAGSNPLNLVNSAVTDNSAAGGNTALPLAPKQFGASVDGCQTAIQPLRSISEIKSGRVNAASFWDGRNRFGNVVEDGDYVFVIYAALPSQNGFPFDCADRPAVAGPPRGGCLTDMRIWTSQAKTGYVTVARGLVGISQITPGTSIVGSSPSVAGLNPFLFRYTLSRDAIVSLYIVNSTGTVIKTLVSNETRPGNFINTETWFDGTGDNGFLVSSGSYVAVLSAADPLIPSKVSTTSVLFPVNLFRIVDVFTSPLLGGASDFATIGYQLSQTMNIGLNIYPPGTQILQSTVTWPPCLNILPGSGCAQITNANGGSVGPVFTISGMRPGRRSLTEIWDGRDPNGLLVPDGVYIYTLTAQSTGSAQGIPVNYFATDKILGNVIVAHGSIQFLSFNVKPDIPQLFNSSTTITLHPFSIEYSLTRQSSVTIQVLTTATPPQVTRTVVAGGVRDPGILITDVWDGRDDRGNFPPLGFYTVRATAVDLATQVSPLTSLNTAQFTLSYDPLRIYDVAISPIRQDASGSVISYQVSETMKVAIKIYRPGTVFDPAGNPTPSENQSLVKRIVGIKPARVQIQETWDGTDQRQSQVPDGTYRFRIIGSTDAAAIDSLTGNVLNPSALSLDQPIDDIPVARNASADPQIEFINNTFVYPNPVAGPNATIQIFVPQQAHVTAKIFSIAGALVYDWDFGELPANSCVQDPQCRSGLVWNKVNKSGKHVGRGMYYVVVREEESLGTRTVLQTVKKILIP